MKRIPRISKSGGAEQLRPIGIRESFLSCFSARHRPEVVEFGKRLRKLDADYLIFMARKSVCFYESLATLKLTELRGILVSDRVLDMDLSWLKGKRVALIDDAVIYGSTLAKVAAALQNAGATISDTIVFCVNATSWKRELVQPSEPFLRLDERETTGFCADLVRAISVVPMPYAVDYPIIRRLRISDQDLPQVLCLPGWGTKAHTTPLQHANSVSALACTPTPSKLAQLFSSTEAKLAAVCQMVKVRLYGRHLEKHSATWFTLMPIVVLDPISNEHINELWQCVRSGSGDEMALLSSEFETPTAKLRAIQFIVAARVASRWIRDVNAILGLRMAPRIDSTFAGFAFPPPVSRSVCSVAARGINFSAATSVKVATGGMLKIEKPLETYEPNPWSLQAALIKPFIDLHVQKEVPARQQRLPIDELPDPILNRLNEGFSLAQLRQAVTAVSGALPSYSVLSEFLDYAIDRGFIVPISATHKGVVFRAYRYGEDIRDAEQFRLLCSRCVHSFLEASEMPAISRTWLEKLLVLLLHGLLDHKLIDPTDLAVGSSGTIGVRYALHGAVLKEEAPRVYSHYDGQFYVDVLEKYGFLRRTDVSALRQVAETPIQLDLPKVGRPEKKDRTRYYTPADNRDPIPDAPLAVELSEAIGLLFGSLASRSSVAQQFSLDDITLLATCHSPASTAAALAAELDILCENWRYTEHKLRKNNSLVSADTLRAETWFTALNSARRKFRDYLLDVSDQKLDRIEADLIAAKDKEAKEAKFVLSGLRSFRRLRLTRKRYSEADPRYSLLLELGRLVYELNIFARILILGNGRFGAKITKAVIIDEVAKLLTEHASTLQAATSAPQAEHSIRSVLVAAANRIDQPDVDLGIMRDWAMKGISTSVESSREYLLRVDHLVARVGLPNHFDLYPHVVVVELDSPGNFRKMEEEVSSVLIRSVREFNHRQVAGRAYGFMFLPDRNPSGAIAIGFRGGSSKGLLELFCKQVLGTKGRKAIKRLLSFQEIGRDEQPMKSECSPNCIANMFWQRVVECLENPLMRENGVYRLEPCEDQLHLDEPTSRGNGEKGKTITITQPTERIYQVQFDAIQNGSAKRKNFKKTGRPQNADVGIVCATPSELRALKDSMIALQDYLEEEKFEYFSASLPGDGCNHRVVMTFTTDQGNVSAATAVQRFLTKYKPRMLVMLGMAGSVHDDAKLLDVAVSTQVIYYESRKEREQGTTSRIQTLPISPLMKRALTSFLADNGAPTAKLKYVEGSHNYTFKVLEGPFGTGEAIVGSKNSAARNLVKQVSDKTIVVETEAWGVHKAVYENNGLGKSCKHVLTIKGVADCADEDKDDERQYRATRNAFETLRAFMATLAKSDIA